MIKRGRMGPSACSRRLGSDNQTDGDHGERVRAFAVQLFDKTKKLHGIPGKRRLLLDVLLCFMSWAIDSMRRMLPRPPMT